MSDRFITMVGGSRGSLRVHDVRALSGESLDVVPYLDVRPWLAPAGDSVARWQLSGAVSNLRYATSKEREHYGSLQPPLGRAEARFGALIPIRKSAAWWELPQDTRRSIIADDSRHIAIGAEYLPAIARRLLHCRDLGSPQPFDFLTWFEFAPEYATAFDELLARLRATREWEYVEREVEVRFERIVS
jgi:hypothetical protein